MGNKDVSPGKVPMTGYLIRRILWMIPVLFSVTLITFIIMHATPGGPWDVDPNSRASDPRIQQILNRQYGLDLPLFFNAEDGQAAMAAGQDPVAVAQGFLDAQFEKYL